MIAKTIVLTTVLVLFNAPVYADECNSVRYSDNGDGTVTDCRTGLIWLLANCKYTSGGIENLSGQLSWYDALDPILTDAAGTAKWTSGNAFLNVQSYAYWSSNTPVDVTNVAWYIFMSGGFVSNDYKAQSAYVLPVRG